MSVVDDLSDVLADCGFVHFELPAEGAGSTYVAVIVPHPEVVFDEDADGGLDASTAVRVYAIPDAVISAEQRQILSMAGGADLSLLDEELPSDGPEAAALLVDSWVRGEWADRLVYCFNHEPLSYFGATAPDRPTALVTFTLPASAWDEVASRY